MIEARAGELADRRARSDHDRDPIAAYLYVCASVLRRNGKKESAGAIFLAKHRRAGVNPA